MGLTERLKRIREYRHLSQETMAEWLGITKQAWGRKERGEIAGFSIEDLATVLQKTDIDARYLCGQIDRIEDADLTNPLKPEMDLSAELLHEIRELRKLKAPTSSEDKILHRVRVSERLYDFVKKVAYLDPPVLQRLDDMVSGFLWAKESTEDEREEKVG